MVPCSVISLDWGKCKNSPYKCAIKIKVDKVKVELKYLEKLFNATYQKFLTAIDHVDYHPTQTKLKFTDLQTESNATQSL